MMTGRLEEVISEVPEGIADARASVIAMLDAYEREAGVSGDRVVLGGFSQGSMLATDIVLRSRITGAAGAGPSVRPVAGLVVMSGTLLAAREWLPLMAERKGLPASRVTAPRTALAVRDRPAPPPRVRGGGDAGDLHRVRRRPRHHHGGDARPRRVALQADLNRAGIDRV